MADPVNMRGTRRQTDQRAKPPVAAHRISGLFRQLRLRLQPCLPGNDLDKKTIRIAQPDDLAAARLAKVLDLGSFGRSERC